MPNRVPHGLLVATAVSALAAGGALAEKVTLKTLDQSFSVEGEITQYDGTNFTLTTSIGDITVDASLVICEGEGCPKQFADSPAFTIAGDRTLALRLFPALLRDYAADEDAITTTTQADNARMVMDVTGGDFPEGSQVTIVPTTTSDGLDALFKGEAQLALSTRPVRVREARAFQEFGLGELRSTDQETILALDGLVFVNNPDNPVRSISTAEAARIFSGEITNWADLGGRDADITLYGREEGASSTEAFDTLVMRPSGGTISGDTTTFTADNAISEAVLSDPNGIGFVSFAGIGGAQAMAIRGECGLQSAPTEFSIKTEEYPLTRLLYMYQTNAPLAAKAIQFRDYILTDEAQTHVGDWGFVNQAVTVESVNTQGLRIASAILENRDQADMSSVLDMIVLFAAADRLSTTFRFETGTPDLNARAQADIERLAAVLATDRFANKEVIFVGFTDSIGDDDLNRQLSQQRAEQVLQTVLARDPSLASNVRMLAVGFGEISPLGCNESDVGRLTNRRVEVWVRDIAEAG